MTFLLLFACKNGCSPTPPSGLDDTGKVSIPLGDSTTWDHDDPDFYSGDWEMPDRAEILAQAELLPPSADGGALVHSDETGSLVLYPDSRTPLTAAAGCAAVVMACWDPDQRSIAACLAHAPACSTEDPWNDDALCCDDACLPRYLELREQGMKMTLALPRAVFDHGSCMPGVDDFLGEGR